jgi:hypothetical protein
LRTLRIALVAISLLYLAKLPVAAETIAGVARIIDGDTIGDTIEVQEARMRIHGIDAPELGQQCSRGGRSYRCGEESRAALKRIIAGAAVTCTIRGADRYGRVIATCGCVLSSRKPQDIARELVRRDGPLPSPVTQKPTWPRSARPVIDGADYGRANLSFPTTGVESIRGRLAPVTSPPSCDPAC